MIDKPISVEEKRRFARVESYLPIHYKNLKKLKEPATGVFTNDIGEGGIRFKSNEFISMACRLLLEINLPTAQNPLRAISKVAWIRKSSDGREYEVGNQFLEISKEDRVRIVEFVNKLLGSASA